MAEAPDLVIVSSPLQYMNAVEQRRLEDREADLVLIGDRHGAGATVDILMARQAPWRAVHRHGRRPRPARWVPKHARDALDALHRSGLKRLARRLGQAPRRQVVFGDYRNVSQRVLVSLMRAEETVLLDDGSVTPQAAAYRADPERAPEPGQFDLGWFRTAFARSMFGEYVPADPLRLTFFSIYEPVMRERLAEPDRVVGHAYDAWRRGGPGRRGRTIWLLGSDHAEAGICTFEDYRGVILRAAAKLRLEGGAELLYRPHRGEAPDKVARIATEAGLAVVRTGAPIELDYLDAAEKPALVAAIASSALDTLAVLDPELDIARIGTPDGYLRRRADHIRAVVEAHHAFNPRLKVINPASRTSNRA